MKRTIVSTSRTHSLKNEANLGGTSYRHLGPERPCAGVEPHADDAQTLVVGLPLARACVVKFLWKYAKYGRRDHRAASSERPRRHVRRGRVDGGWKQEGDVGWSDRGDGAGIEIVLGDVSHG